MPKSQVLENSVPSGTVVSSITSSGWLEVSAVSEEMMDFPEKLEHYHQQQQQGLPILRLQEDEGSWTRSERITQGCIYQLAGANCHCNHK